MKTANFHKILMKEWVNEKNQKNLQNNNFSSNLYVRPCLNMDQRDCE
jgi:hypothetical protein